jgi:hypothetical protein
MAFPLRSFLNFTGHAPFFLFVLVFSVFSHQKKINKSHKNGASSQLALLFEQRTFFSVFTIIL